MHENLIKIVDFYNINILIKSLVMTFILILIIFFTYKKTYQSDDYKSKFNILLSVLILITTMIMNVIRTNLNVSLGMLGILSIIRFRVKISDFRDVGFILWGIGAGVTIGTEHYLIGFTYTIIISIYLIIVNNKIYKKNTGKILIVRSNKIDEKKLDALLTKECNVFQKIKNTKNETYTEILYTIECDKIRNLEDKLTSKLDLDFIKFV